MTDPIVPLEDAPDAPDDEVDEGPDFDPSTRGPDGPAPVPADPASENDDDTEPQP